MSWLNRKGWTRFLTLVTPILQSEARWRALGLFGLLIGFQLSINGLNVFNSYVGRYFITAIATREAARYVPLALTYVGVFAGATLLDVFFGFTEGRLALLWRDWLTRHILDRYLSRHAYYRVNERADIDNPDQRISEDVRNFTNTTLAFALMILNSAITILSFLGVLWSITPWLFLIAVLYAGFGSAMTIVLGHRLIGLNNLQLKKEADFRYELVHLREHAESIAQLGGEAQQKCRLLQRLDEVVANMKDIIAVSRNLGFFTTAFNYMIQLLPLLIAAPLYLRGQVEFGVVTQAAMAFAQVVAAFSLIVSQFQNISAFAAVIGRVSALWEAIERGAKPEAPAIETREDDTRVAYEGLTLKTPKTGRVLTKDLSVEVRPRQRLLVTGPNGAGKTALFRATLGIWEAGEGRILRPRRDQLLFLSQRPYTVPGSLREQFTCGNPEHPFTDEQILAALAEVQFQPVLERVGGLDAQRDWANLLSVGEQQLLGFARLLLVKPPFAFLDEAVKALTFQRARALYRVLSRTAITYISVAAHPDLLEFHDTVLELREDGGWEVWPAQREAAG